MAILRRLLAASAVAFSVLYLLSDLIELGQGGFSSLQLWLTYVAEAAIPLLVIGLYAAQRPNIGRIGLLGALGYACAYIFFTSTVVYALVDNVGDWSQLTDRFGAWITIHGAVMVFAGIAFGVAVIRAGVLPRWTGICLVAGVLLVAISSGLPDVVQTAAAGVRDLAFAGMGVALLRASQRTAR